MTIFFVHLVKWSGIPSGSTEDLRLSQAGVCTVMTIVMVYVDSHKTMAKLINTVLQPEILCRFSYLLHDAGPSKTLPGLLAV